MASRNLTMVVCGSVGLAADVADTVDGSGAFFFVPNQFIVIALFIFFVATAAVVGEKLKAIRVRPTARCLTD
jgi:hypothetical protein